MSNIIPFKFDSFEIRAITSEAGEPWFVAADVCAVLDVSNVSQACSRLDGDERTDITTNDVAGRPQATVCISESGLYSLILTSRKPEAKRFKKWVTSEVLPSIRKTGRYATPGSAPAPSAITPAKEFEALFSVARLIGLDQNAAALSANQAVTRITGTDMLQLLGTPHLVAEQQVLFYTPTELGERLGVSGRKFNMLLAEAGLQAKEGDAWKPLPAAESFFRLFDTGKRHGGAMVQQLKWADNVLQLVQPEAA